MKATKEQTVHTINQVLEGKRHLSINTDGVQFDLDGKGMADWLTSCGYAVLMNADRKTHGVVVLSCGVEVATNGYVCLTE